MAPVPYTQTLPSSPWHDEPAEAESARGPPPPLPHELLGMAGLQPRGRNAGRKSSLPTGGTACREWQVPSESTWGVIPSRGDRQHLLVTTPYATRYCLNHLRQANPRFILVEWWDYCGGFSPLQPRLEQPLGPARKPGPPPLLAAQHRAKAVLPQHPPRLGTLCLSRLNSLSSPFPLAGLGRWFPAPRATEQLGD